MVKERPDKDTGPSVQRSLSGHIGKLIWEPKGSSWRAALCLHKPVTSYKKGTF